MAKVTLLDRIKMRMPAMPQQQGAQSSVPASGQQIAPKNPSAPKQPKTASAAKIPGINTKMDGNSSSQTFKTSEQPDPSGRPKNDPMKPLHKALNAAQKHKIMTEVNQNLGQKNLSSNDPSLQALGREQQDQWGKPGESGPPVPEPVTQTQIKIPATPAKLGVDAKTSKINIGGDLTAPLSNVGTSPLVSQRTPSGTSINPRDINETKTIGGENKAQSPLLHPSVNKDRKKDIQRINTEFGYKNVKSKDPMIAELGRKQLKEAPITEKIRYRGHQLIGILKQKILKHEQEINDLKKNESKPLLYGPRGEVAVPADKPDEPKKKKKKVSYKPRVKVTKEYQTPGRLNVGKFLMGVLGSGSPVANRVLNAAKSSVSKSEIEKEWEIMCKNQHFVDKHVKMLSLVYSGSIDSSSLVNLLKKD